MTFNRNKAIDAAKTSTLLANPPKSFPKPNWLGHKGGNAEIDYELLTGTTITSMESHRGAVSEPLRILSSVKGLKVTQQRGQNYFFPPNRCTLGCRLSGNPTKPTLVNGKTPPYVTPNRLALNWVGRFFYSPRRRGFRGRKN